MDKSWLTDLLTAALDELDIAGGGQVALFDGDQVLSAASGIANANGNIPVVDTTLFQIGSTTKVYNAVLLMQLVEKSEVDLDTPVDAYLDIQISPDQAERQITPRQLLSMSSGIDNGPYHDTGRDDDCLSKYLECLADLPMIHEPGEGYGYTNASSDVAGRITETRQGAPWEQVLTDKLIRPLGLAHSDALIERVIRHPVAVGHHGSRAAPKLLPFWALYRGHAPAGSSLCTSATDLVNFAKLFLGESSDVLSREGIALMHEKQVDTPTGFMAHGWCLGPYYKVWDGVEIYGHSGTNLGGSSTLLWIPSKGISVAVTCNDPPKGYPLAERCFRALLAEFGIRMPGKATPLDAADQNLDELPGRYEAHGVEINITKVDDNTLHARKVNRQLPGTETVLESNLRPLGNGRFLIDDPLFSGGRDWDIAFWGDHLTDGVFTLRRAAPN